MNIFYQKRHLIHYGSGAFFYFWTVRNLTAPFFSFVFVYVTAFLSASILIDQRQSISTRFIHKNSKCVITFQFKSRSDSVLIKIQISEMTQNKTDSVSKSVCLS
ncbi:hypothetical protein BO224_01735 [Erysipelotrichaceae bacterium NYU-BL-E8]|uniref:Uncharacterized protein n=1 Tax=Ileibacterium valens TaxID=1862668 RepID=A0A1U7NIS9_9FIRM|nr:hypothetical protein BO224_01735 [Erysipelotrichaceae bacterium NYU-BL-E8]OLU42618.1 hypothetical protein BO222_01270 [Ileibacterium valens]OLU42702.1 hypothetical protein BM735_01755 [Erysipelotrichaceae bacterium NYU-BL-F16]